MEAGKISGAGDRDGHLRLYRALVRCINNEVAENSRDRSKSSICIRIPE